MAGHQKFGSEKTRKRVKRKGTIRKRITGTAERPRLSVFRSAKHIYAQAVDDATNTVLASASDLEETLEKELAGKKKKDKAFGVGQAVARTLGLDERLLVATSVHDVPMKAPRPQYAALSNDKLAEAGVRMPTWEDGLARYLSRPPAA